MGGSPIGILILTLALVFGGRALQKLFERVGKQASADVRKTGPYVATPDEVREFLRSLGRLREGQAAPAGQADRAEGPAGPAVRRAPGGRPGPARARAATPPRVARRRPKVAAPVQGGEVPSPGVQDVSTPRQPAAQQPAVGVGGSGFSLRQAVIWSEILGRPVSLRGREHCPPAAGLGVGSRGPQRA